MEEIRQVALAYYANFPDEQKQRATEVFGKIDKNGDGKVRLHEFAELFKHDGLADISHAELFKYLDTNGDGTLNFKEFVTVFYLLVTNRLIFCKGCLTLLTGVYFSCNQCFCCSSGDTYDICSACYSNKNFDHHHQIAGFLDNYTLLRSSRKLQGSNHQTGVDMIQTAMLGLSATNFVINTAPEVLEKGKIGAESVSEIANNVPKLLEKAKGKFKSASMASDAGSAIDAGSHIAEIGGALLDVASSCSIM